MSALSCLSFRSVDFSTFLSQFSPLQKTLTVVTGVALGGLALYAFLNRHVLLMQYDIRRWNHISLSDKRLQKYDLIKTTEAHLAAFGKEAENSPNVAVKIQGLKLLEKLDKALLEAPCKAFTADGGPLGERAKFSDQLKNNLHLRISKLRGRLGLTVQKPVNFTKIAAPGAGRVALSLLQETTKPKTYANQNPFEIGLPHELKITYNGTPLDAETHARFIEERGDSVAKKIALLARPEHFKPFIENCSAGLQVLREDWYRHFVVITWEKKVILSLAIVVKIKSQDATTAKILKRTLTLETSMLTLRHPHAFEGKVEDFVSDEIINYETAIGLLEQ